MRILVTADTVGGVWTYTRELISGLIHRGHSVVLVSFGRNPTDDQILWTRAFPSEAFQYYPTEFPLEWMQDAEFGIAESFKYLKKLIRETAPDVLHLSQFCYGSLACDIPKIVIAHSDVSSWWKAVHGDTPPASNWFDWYAEVVTKGLANADAVVAPTRWMLEQVLEHYHFSGPGFVIHNGRTPGLFNSGLNKINCALTVGRLWDEGKQISLLLEREQAVHVEIVGPKAHPGTIRSNRPLSPKPGLKISDARSEAELSETFSQASIYVGTSRYEPFGLTLVEAALSRCALIANDIPVFHELWEDCAFYFERNDPDALASAIRELSSNRALRESYADRAYECARRRFDSTRMVEQYERLYYELASKSAAA
jgi:glycogen synthase